MNMQSLHLLYIVHSDSKFYKERLYQKQGMAKGLIMSLRFYMPLRFTSVLKSQVKFLCNSIMLKFIFIHISHIYFIFNFSNEFIDLEDCTSSVLLKHSFFLHLDYAGTNYSQNVIVFPITEMCSKFQGRF